MVARSAPGTRSASDVVDDPRAPLLPLVSGPATSLVLVPVLVPVLVLVSRSPLSPELDGQYVTPCSVMIASIFSMAHAVLLSVAHRRIWTARRAR